MLALVEQVSTSAQSTWLIVAMGVLSGSALTAFIQVLAVRRKTAAEAKKANLEGDASLVSAASQLFDTFGTQTLNRIAQLESELKHLESEMKALQRENDELRRRLAKFTQDE